MKNGICPKCGSTTVYSLANGITGQGGKVYLKMGAINYPVNSQSFACSSCGYFENYINDPTRQAEIAQKWFKVPPAQ